MRFQHARTNDHAIRQFRRKNTLAKARIAHAEVSRSKRARGTHVAQPRTFMPPENWHEPTGGADYRVVVQAPGVGYRHVVTEQEVRERLALLPQAFVERLELLQLSSMTRKKKSFPCYGLQWGAAVYLYPLEDDLVEYYSRPPKPQQQIEARQYGARWEPADNGMWRLVWTEATAKDFFLNNILIHEIGHLVDDRNTRSVDRERYAEWFALEYGYKGRE